MVFALSIGVSVYWQHSDLKALRAQLGQVEKQLTITRKAILPSATMPQPVNDALFNARVEKVNQALAEQAYLQQVLAANEPVNTSGFDSHLESLARVASNEISIRAFMFTDGGRQAALYGVTTDPSRVPVYVSRLGAEESFRKTRFGLMKVSRVEGSLYHEFTLGNVSPAYQARNMLGQRR